MKTLTIKIKEDNKEFEIKALKVILVWGRKIRLNHDINR
jgi:hypothetical protein